MNNFVPDQNVWNLEFENGLDTTTKNGITTFKPNLFGFKYYVKVGCGYRGFDSKREAKKYLNS